MKRLLIAIGLCLVFCFTGFAQQNDDTPATKADIQRYLEVMHSHEMMQQMADTMTKQMRQMLHQQFLKDKDKLPQDFEDRMNKLMDDMFRDMPWDEMVQAMIPAYQKHLTRGDVNQLIAFYSSPTGQKLLREMPDDGRCGAIDDAHHAELHGESSATGKSGNSTVDEGTAEEVRPSRAICSEADQRGRFLVCACWICAASLNSRFAISILPSWR